MNNDLSSYFEEPEFKEILAKYEGMVYDHTSIYFDAEELTDIAEFYASQGREKEAEKAIDFALLLHPSNTDALVFKSRSLCIKGKLNEAYQVMDLIEDTSDREVQFLKADLLIEEGRLEEADEIFQALAKSEDESAEVLIDIALSYMDANQELSSAEWLEKVREKGINETNSQKFRDVWCDFCTTFNQPEKAINAYQITLDKYPYSINHWIGLAKCYLMMNDVIQAHEAVDFSLAIDENNQEALEVKSFCFLQSENYEEAIVYCQKLMHMTKDKCRMYAFLTKCYLELERTQEALDNCMEWLENCQKLTGYEKSEIYCYIAMCYCNLNQPENGMKYIDASLDLNPFNRACIIQKGMLHLQLEENEKAEELFMKAIALSPTEEEAETHYAIVNCYFCLGRINDIIHWCEKIIKDYPEEQKEALLHIANCYYEANDIRMCLKALATYWELNDRFFDNDTLEDKRFKKMFSAIGEILNGKNFNLNDYL